MLDLEVALNLPLALMFIIQLIDLLQQVAKRREILQHLAECVKLGVPGPVVLLPHSLQSQKIAEGLEALAVLVCVVVEHLDGSHEVRTGEMVEVGAELAVQNALEDFVAKKGSHSSHLGDEK